MGEGAGVLVLESERHAKARGATLHAEVAGIGRTSDAHHITAPDPEARHNSRCMTLGIEQAGLPPADIDYLNAHGTSTVLNDRSETMAIRKVFGDKADEVSVSSTKSMTGHLMAGAAAIESVTCVQAIQNGVVPPTINYETPDPECDLDITPNIAKERPIKAVLNNAFGFGGHNACLVFKAP